MKKYLLIFLSLTISSSAFAGARGSNCGLNKNIRQISSLEQHFQSKGLGHLFHNASRVGKEDREIVSKDYRSEEAQLANKIGSIFVLENNVHKAAGTGQLIRWKNEVYLVASGHGFFDVNGRAKFKSKTASWMPNTHYYGLNDEVASKEYTFNTTPLNLEQVKKRGTTQVDIAIFKIDQSAATDKVFGIERGASKLSEKSSKQLYTDFNNAESALIAEHANFENGLEVAISRNCSTLPPTSDKLNKLGLHKCDTGSGASGAGLYVKEYGSFVLGGVHVRGRTEENGGDFSEKEFEEGKDSNRFVPIDLIREQFLILEKEGKISSEPDSETL